jgi:DNA-directed RNA polymerase III subunit RPC11
MKRKEVEDVMGGANAWDNVDQTDGMSHFGTFLISAQCTDPNCGGNRAYFYQVQIRSADEPMTTFYKVCHILSSSNRQCTKCGSRWKEN